MFSVNIKRCFVLLVGNSNLDSCKEDVYRMEKLFLQILKNQITFPIKYSDYLLATEKSFSAILKNDIELHIVKKFNVYVLAALKDFISSIPNLCSDDLLYIHYSGHGILVGKKINGKIEMISTWENDNDHNNDKNYNKDEIKKSTYSYEVDFLLSGLKCQIMLVSDSCHSEAFGKFYNGKSPFLFIGSSSIVNLSREYSINGKPNAGALTNFFEYCFDHKKLNYNLDILKKELEGFFRKHGIKHKPIVKSYNI
jgi:hypothetical protein